MKLLPFALLLLTLPAAAQTALNPRLKHGLDSIYAVDQRYRTLLFDSRVNRNPDSLARALGKSREELYPYLNKQLNATDAANQARVKAIIKQYGYPGKTLVGEPTNEAAWYVIQHSDDIDTYLPQIKKAAKKGELPYYLYAQMLDRQLMRSGKPQLYGTQALSYNVTNPQNGQREGQPPFIWPIKNAAQVNERRRKAGFPTTVEANATRMGIPYRVVTMEEVARMPKE
ncbi:hypothetical protein Q5H93_09350 [Hymenobacter sp. ASUV-10]|uniref:DUF4919 domain-containing protein n=1 Tax=Hymenobacter aranciens TaxID=3063996 RepID=A0ABT9B9J3_9BACT|nr:DUF6624 domain-containing protein [Hymenobacter sp. ASUV-10]MDO7874936.1 hypothetical protein [Hymenobacter sp. ASUV-10]